MEALKQSLKIGVGLAALVAVTVVALPERPTLLGGAGAQPAAEDLLLAGAVPVEEHEAAEAAQAGPVRVAQAASTGAATPSGEPTAGQLHLQRLRERAAGGGAAAPAAPAPQPTAPAPAPSAPAAPSKPPEPSAAAPEPAPEAGGGQGIGSLTEPAARPQFRLFRSARPVDSATLRVDGQDIRLLGIEAVPADARCADGADCGAQARTALGEWLAGQEVLCAITPGATLAPCLRGEKDVGEWAVENGWAQAEPGSAYEAAEAKAREDGLGIWGSGGL